MATARLFNLARMTTATTGTGTVTLGSAVTGFLTFAQAGVTDGATVTYAIKDGNNSEIGRGVYTLSGTTLTRATILNSTNSNNALNLSGSAEVFITPAAQDFVPATNAQTGTTYTVLGTDLGKIVTLSNAASIAVTLPQATGVFADGWYGYFLVRGAGTATITPTTSTINGASSLVLPSGSGALIFSDGTNYNALITIGTTLLLADGSASAPSLSNDGDTNTGIWFPAADTLGISTGGSERLRVNSSGNVGIGTSAPTYRLHVADSSFPAIGFFRDTDVTVSGAALQSIELGARNGSTFTPGAAVYGTLDNPATTGTLSLQTRSGGSLTERVRVDSNGQMRTTNGAGTLALAYDCRAWVNFSASGSVTIRASGNVTSITDNGTGDFTVNFTTAMSDANYAAVFGNNSPVGGSSRATFISNSAAPTSSALRINTYDGTSALVDLDYVSVAIFR